MKQTVTINRGYDVRDPEASITCEAEPIEIEVDTNELARGPAEAIADAVQRGIRGNPERTRDGKRRLFVRTGKLAAGITAIPTPGADGSYTIAGPPGYLQDDKLAERLRHAVPVIDDPFSDRTVCAAIEQATADMVTVGKARSR